MAGSSLGHGLDSSTDAASDVPPGPLAGTRVLDRTTGIPGPYATKLLVDAGADVVKVEAGGADPLRGCGAGALFEYLNAGKRSVASDDGLVEVADILFVDEPSDVETVRAANPALVVVSITPFGIDGPWANRPATEFTLQAIIGSTGQRGLPEDPPLAAGGRIGEWLTGTYAAVAALAALREARRGGQGELVDVAMCDCMAVSLILYPSLTASFVGAPPEPSPLRRSIEIPSVEPTADGHVVITTTSAQQFEDFLLLIDRTDLLDDSSITQAGPRFERRAEFLPMVHAYTTTRTTEQVLEEAGELRIPSGPVLNGSNVTSFEQFVARGVFEPAASGRFLRPRRPYAIDGDFGPPPRLAPNEGADTRLVDWGARPVAASEPWRLPLSGLRILDLTAWWAGPVAASALAALGADVIKIESVTRADNFRFATGRRKTDDQWYEWSVGFHGTNLGKRGITLDLRRAECVGVFERLLASADVLIENNTPRVMEQFGLGWDHVHHLNPKLHMVRMPAFGLDGPWRDRTGFAQTIEAVTGMAWITGEADGPPVLLRGACDPLAGMHAVIATLVALLQRDSDGQGRLVESVMVEAALNVAAEQVIEYTANGTLLARDGNRGPIAAPQGLYRCAGDDRWLAIAVQTDEHWAGLVEVIGRPSWATVAELLTHEGRRADHDRIDEGLAVWSGGEDVDDAVEQLVAAGVPAARVSSGWDMAVNPQLRHRGLFEVEDHVVTGRHEVAVFPARFGRVDAWNLRPSPAFGQHNDEVFAELGLIDELERLRGLGLAGERLRGA